MNSILQQLYQTLFSAVKKTGLILESDTFIIKPCEDLRFGDYQSNVAMVTAKKHGQNPRALAEMIANEWSSTEGAKVADLSIAGPGFLNFKLNSTAISAALSPRTQRTFSCHITHPRTIVLDYSSPNVAKAMHVGHIRSTILGDCLSRTLRYLGHRVITDNHIGDWGTQFGKLIVGYRKWGAEEKLKNNPIGEMERLYKTAHEASLEDPVIAEQARRELKKLQDGDPDNLALWEKFRSLSQTAFDHIYHRLGVSFDHTLGESFYNSQLNPTINELLQRGVATESEGAICVFFEEASLKDKPFLIRKSDGAALYSTTDLATLRYRIEQFQPDAIWYVTDMRQNLHFQQLFATAQKWGIQTELCHIGFGAILGQDKRPLKTREGDPIKLETLLDEAINRAFKIVQERRPDLNDSEKKEIAEILGIGAIKYADLAQNRHLDYVFDWKKLLAFDGNTAPYVLNAYVRIQSIFRKSEESPDRTHSLSIPTHPRERELMVQLLQWEDVLEQVVQEQRPHYLCFYLFNLSGLFHSFFEECPVLKSAPELREHRLALCRITANTLRQGCELLGIRTLEKM